MAEVAIKVVFAFPRKPMIVGIFIKAAAKIIGITPAIFSLIGKCVSILP